MKKSVLKTVRYQIRSPRIHRDMEGFRMAVISDLHDCDIGCGNHLLVEELREQAPDCVLMAGDMITEEKFGEGVFKDNALALLEELSSFTKVYYGMGNHEQRWKEKVTASEDRPVFREYCRRLEDLGVTLLDNRSVCLRRGQGELRLTGLALPNRFYNKKKIVRLSAEQIGSLVGPASPDHFQILLGHTPAFMKAYCSWGADLTLAGHYHGGVIRLPWLGGLISTNFRLFPKYDYGRFREEDREMIVTAGLGCHTIPVRLNNPPELVILDVTGE